MPHHTGHTGNVSVVGTQKARSEGKAQAEPILEFLWGRRGRVNSLGLAGVNNSSGLWATGVVSSCLVPGPGMT